ncbi:uncharacterized protein EpC_26690 [Erwinia pyrifoliae Ep1/96]|nr:uncharacterized protein EpC_26690 [Erwinia pyrifoliae Ep1/96]
MRAQYLITPGGTPFYADCTTLAVIIRCMVKIILYSLFYGCLIKAQLSRRLIMNNPDELKRSNLSVVLLT